MDSRVLDLEQLEIISYLYTYGNIRETDLIAFGVQTLGKSEVSMKKVVDEMVLCGRLERFMHNELKPAVAYVKYGATVQFELELQAFSDSLGTFKVTEREVESVKKILAKAKAAAAKSVKRKHVRTLALPNRKRAPQARATDKKSLKVFQFSYFAEKL
jgi:hypothetical protein